MSILKLKPACKDYLWGGHRLVDEYNVEYEGDILAEAWELSCHPDGPSMIMNGPYKGKSLREYLEAEGMEVLGTHCRRFREFPILTKFIDAKDNLSIQVHPSNGFALQNEGQYGKTEMWYVLDAEEGAFLYYGFKQEITREEFAKRIEENTLLEVLNAVPVKKGDVLFIESGTLHAIGKGILIAEIQQNSNVTYRVYDYGRVGKDGKKRDLHIEKALAVTSRVPIIKSGSEYPHVADCDYFTVDKLNLDGRLTYRMQGTVTGESFLSILILDGEGKISCKGESVSYRKGDSFFLAAGSGDSRESKPDPCGRHHWQHRDADRTGKRPPADHRDAHFPHGCGEGCFGVYRRSGAGDTGSSKRAGDPAGSVHWRWRRRTRNHRQARRKSDLFQQPALEGCGSGKGTRACYPLPGPHSE